MSETQPKVLSDQDTTRNVQFYDNLMPMLPEDGVTRYLVKDGERHELSELNRVDWLILNALFPQGPQVLS